MCYSYKMWNISYVVNIMESIIELDICFKVDFCFLVRFVIGKIIYRGFYFYVLFIIVFGVVLMMRKKIFLGYV